ncbi:TonB-dependent receptor [Sphingobium sp. CR2-8]|uniref:TonB-dependent receptor n=1 Tax=Sphingobium sp. CR2-8 TaxID=1306534 RepID=UPI002DB9EE05|nr:TonB-dependent receptor [Sphingobium sp. CR2-8]MEC3909546.1 TonB-dependent receptor [Sphingobium sp. CR2-8]
MSISIAMIAAISTQPALAEVRNFSIPAQPANSAIATFAKQSGRQILASEELVRGKRANAVVGKLEVEAALRRLLAGTGLVARQPSDATGIITIRRAVAPSPSKTFAPATLASDADGAPNGDIVVTARRRNEASISAPVVVSGVSQSEINRRHLTRVEELNAVIPQLQIGQGSIQGGSIVLRGIGANANTTTADQGVTFNIDGAQVARSSVRRIGQMDLAQIEVLKGPQGLFFGKNSPGGVISMRTADPTGKFEAKLSTLYEFVGREAQIDGFVSGPVTDTLGVRIAFLGSHMSGWEKNIYPSSEPFGVARSRLPHDREAAGRLTLKFDPSDMFDARFKLNYGKVKSAGNPSTRQYVYCPFAIPQLALGANRASETCKADNKVSYTGFGPNFQRFGLNDGDPVLDQQQLLSSLELNYRPSDLLTVTSLTSLYKAKIDWVSPYLSTSDASRVIVGDYHIDLRELSQELRLASSFEGPVNFLAGLYLQDTKFLYDFQDVRNPDNPFKISGADLNLGGSHASIFGQVRINPIATVELAGGGRYSWEKKDVSFKNVANIPLPADPDRTWRNFSPELTAAWRPSSKLTVFANYKRGFLSGGFTPSGAPYQQQVTKGGEAGVKALLFGNRLRANLSAYHYVTTGLQVTYLDGTQFAIANAGKGTVKGIEADLNWQTSVEGLTFRGAIGYNNARYNIYNAGCYPGQSIAAGCNSGLRPTGAYSLQDLRGRPFNNAPDWSGNAGINYESDVGEHWRLGLSADASYTSSYFTESNLAPSSKLGGFWMLDSNIRLTQGGGHWEAALLGRNLTNRHPYQLSNSVLFTGGPSGTNGPTFDADRYGIVNRGRQISLQLTYRFGAQ